MSEVCMVRKKLAQGRTTSGAKEVLGEGVYGKKAKEGFGYKRFFGR